MARESDLHGGNILTAQREPWLVIDPTPLVVQRELAGVGLLRNAAARSNSSPHAVRRPGTRFVAAGPGISENQRERIFERFVRLDPGKPGLGLGLAIARRIAHQHHRELTCDPS